MTILLSACNLDQFVVIFIVAIYMSNFLFEGSLKKQLWSNIISFFIVYSVGTFAGILCSVETENPLGLWYGSRFYLDLRGSVEIVLLCLLTKNSNVRNQLHMQYRRISRRTAIGTLSVLFVVFYMIFVLNAIYSKQFDIFQEPSLFICSFVACTCIIIIVGINEEKNQMYYKWSDECMSEQLQRQLKYCKKMEEYNQQARAIKHDMHNHMIIIRSLAQRGEIRKLEQYVEKIEKTVDRLDYIAHTGNSIVDAILNEKLQIAHEKKIQVEYEVSLSEQLDLEDMDLCVIFANSMDNAIEACEKIEDEGLRNIRLNAVCDRGYFFYNISNSSIGPVKIVNEVVKTNKKDSINHGFGLLNIKQSVERNHGTINIISTDEEFRLEIDVPIGHNSETNRFIS